MADDWVIQGTRPPSVIDNRPRSASAKHFGYHVINSNPSVDETLFKSFHKEQLSEQVNFQPPWNKANKRNKVVIVKKKSEKPLLWSPASDSSCKNFNILKSGSGFRSEKFKLKKHIPTFCDETLFGKTNFTEPNFEAPWNCPVRNNIIYQDMNGNTVNVNNNNSNWRKLKLRTRPSTAPNRRSAPNNHTRPLWKP